MALGERPVKTYWDIELEIEVSGEKRIPAVVSSSQCV